MIMRRKAVVRYSNNTVLYPLTRIAEGDCLLIANPCIRGQRTPEGSELVAFDRAGRSASDRSARPNGLSGDSP